MPTNYAPIDIFSTRRVSVGAEVYVTPLTDDLRPDNADSSGSLMGESITWKNLAQIDTFKFTPETETDEINYRSIQTHAHVKDLQEKIVRTAMEMTAVDYSVLLHAIAMGVPDPLSEATAAQLSAGSAEGVPVFTSNKPDVSVGMRIDFYDEQNRKMLSYYIYAKIKATGESSFDGKSSLKPTITAEVIPSVHNRMRLTAAFTGQTEAS